ncbi:prepilin peptidase [Streptococcus parasanguinis]|uniref:Prepilin peptidase n=1 Tax=Streptococcus parasanguinis TaxID=1318 RepID=A0A6L6LF47_STRPA|nr:A24 family peptidase [Streptococcus parasanguinis]MTR63424.1 prepilin peptidase [Streptococcus parasanguinis]MTR65365.1 prepilin peptidase [Streptococcus parasanguinis]MTR68299.1 prepilin peptidase [Streptococcus parasanguinis]MTS05293.1 prepilin peptidase [Streptococcus parasanguinis]
MINFYFFTIGTCIASFLGLVVDRFPNQSILAPRSHCDHCQHILGVWDLIPIISQLLHRFRCRYCHQTYPFWYCLFEVWSGLLFLAYANGSLSLPHLLTLLGVAILAIYDLRFMEYPLVIWCCLHALVLFLSGGNLLMLVFLLLAIGAHFFFIGIGAGDFLLLATFSLTFSSTKILFLIQIASILGILVFALKKERDRIPFVPCLFLSYHALLLYTMFCR